MSHAGDGPHVPLVRRPPQQVFAAKEAQLKELQTALATERAGRAADAEGVAWLQSKVDALTQENYEVRAR